MAKINEFLRSIVDHCQERKIFLGVGYHLIKISATAQSTPYIKVSAFAWYYQFYGDIHYPSNALVLEIIAFVISSSSLLTYKSFRIISKNIRDTYTMSLKF